MQPKEKTLADYAREKYNDRRRTQLEAERKADEKAQKEMMEREEELLKAKKQMDELEAENREKR